MRLWFRVLDFQFSVVEGWSFVPLLCMCMFVSFLLFADFRLCMFVFFCHVLCFIFYYKKSLLFFSLPSICLLIVGLHLHDFGLIILFFGSVFLLFADLAILFLSLFAVFHLCVDGWIAFAWFSIDHIIPLGIYFFGYAFLLFTDLAIFFLVEVVTCIG